MNKNPCQVISTICKILDRPKKGRPGKEKSKYVPILLISSKTLNFQCRNSKKRISSANYSWKNLFVNPFNNPFKFTSTPESTKTCMSRGQQGHCRKDCLKIQQNVSLWIEGTLICISSFEVVSTIWSVSKTIY